MLPYDELINDLHEKAEFLAISNRLSKPRYKDIKNTFAETICRYNGDTEFDACHICNNETDMYRPRRTRADTYFREATNERIALNLTALVAVLPFEGLNSYEKWLAWLNTEIGEDDSK